MIHLLTCVTSFPVTRSNSSSKGWCPPRRTDVGAVCSMHCKSSHKGELKISQTKESIRVNISTTPSIFVDRCFLKVGMQAKVGLQYSRMCKKGYSSSLLTSQSTWSDYEQSSIERNKLSHFLRRVNLERCILV